jgi:hypothetical protein
MSPQCAESPEARRIKAVTRGKNATTFGQIVETGENVNSKEKAPGE